MKNVHAPCGTHLVVRTLWYAPCGTHAELHGSTGYACVVIFNISPYSTPPQQLSVPLNFVGSVYREVCLKQHAIPRHGLSAVNAVYTSFFEHIATC